MPAALVRLFHAHRPLVQSLSQPPALPWHSSMPFPRPCRRHAEQSSALPSAPCEELQPPPGSPQPLRSVPSTPGAFSRPAHTLPSRPFPPFWELLSSLSFPRLYVQPGLPIPGCRVQQLLLLNFTQSVSGVFYMLYI